MEEKKHLPKFDYHLDESDPDVAVLRRQDGTFVAAFSARGPPPCPRGSWCGHRTFFLDVRSAATRQLAQRVILAVACGCERADNCIASLFTELPKRGVPRSSSVNFVRCVTYSPPERSMMQLLRTCGRRVRGQDCYLPSPLNLG
jgi:hypothetical protein